MFYQYLLPLNCISNIFGILRPYNIIKGKSSPTNLWMKLWCLVIAALLITSFCLSITVTEFSFKNNLELTSDINELAVNILIILLNLFNGEVCIKLYDVFNLIFNDFYFDQNILKLFVCKMYIWFALPSIGFVILAIVEIVSKTPPYDILLNIPILLTTIDLSMYLYTILALLKVINIQLACKLSSYKIKNEDIETKITARYVLSPEIKFVNNNNQVYYDIKLLCKIYDNLSTSVHLLEQKHGFEVLLLIWLMLTNGVFGVTLLACNKASIKWLVLLKTILPFFWGFIICLINEQLRAEVDQTITLIIKCLIDYKCVPTMKPTLETFKLLVSNDQLQFTACSLFNLRYSMLLGTVINVITYSVIMIQVF